MDALTWERGLVGRIDLNLDSYFNWEAFSLKATLPGAPPPPPSKGSTPQYKE